MTPKAKLTDLIANPGIVIIPGVYDALSARIAEKVGFTALFATGAGISNSYLGWADVGLLSLTELVTQVEHICEVTNIPVIADADTGFGGTLNIRRVVHALEQAGAAGMILEDQVFPKRCGHFSGKDVVSKAEMISRLKVALDARNDSNFKVVARTDALQVEGVDAAINRMQAYFDLGADVGFIEAPRTLDEIEKIASAFTNEPLLINMVEGGKTPLLSASELDSLGYKFMLCANTALRAAIHGIQEALKILNQGGNQRNLNNIICTWEERQALVQADYLLALDDQYRVNPEEEEETIL